MNAVFLGIGSNLNDPAVQCRRALEWLSRSPGVSIAHVSPWFLTEPLGECRQPWFLNGVIELQTRLEPLELLNLCRDLENRAGRLRTIPWGPRTLDLDILLWSTRVMISSRLRIPHPRMHQRRFVLAPMCVIGPDVVHPLTGTTMQQLLEQLEDTLAVKPLSASHGENIYETCHRSFHPAT